MNLKQLFFYILQQIINTVAKKLAYKGHHEVQMVLNSGQVLRITNHQKPIREH